MTWGEMTWGEMTRGEMHKARVNVGSEAKRYRIFTLGMKLS
jgi:hypothetical protein